MDTQLDQIKFLGLIKEVDLAEKPAFDQRIVYLTSDLLRALGEDLNREGLRHTPERVARMYGEILAGYRTDVVELVNGAIFESDYHDMVVVRDIEFYSLCEHHMLPFYGQASVAYIPDGKIIGLSKIPRLVEMYARRLQVQERMTQQIAEALETILHPKGVAVVVEGMHLCAMMRGIKKVNTNMVTSAVLGAFKEGDVFGRLMAHLQRKE